MTSLTPVALEALYGTPTEPTTAKVTPHRFRCARAELRAGLWRGENDAMAGRVGGAAYDSAGPARAEREMW